MNKVTLMRKLMLETDLLELGGGAYDCLSAKTVENAGFKVTSITGYGVHASLIGQPDVGLLTMTELVTVAGNIVNAVDIPVLMDADQGFGGPIHIQRTIKELEKAGVVGLFIDDQVFPSSAGGKAIVSSEVMVSRIKTALASRENPDFIICARTDADIVSMDEVIKRCNIYAEAGADLVMPVLPRPVTIKTFQAIAEGIKHPMWFTAANSEVSIGELRGLGIKGLVNFSGGPILMMSAFYALSHVLEEFRAGRNGQEILKKMGTVNPAAYQQMIGLAELVEFEKKYSVKG